jgi:phosphoserine/homoserine phosphotransferase
MRRLGSPLLLCHRLVVESGRIVGYRIRQSDPKRQSVKAFQDLRYRVHAVGDSFNDIPMLEQADRGFFYRAPAPIAAQYPQFPLAADYATLVGLLEDSARAA